jgi:hypothetical protein
MVIGWVEVFLSDQEHAEFSIATTLMQLASACLRPGL